MTKEPQQRKYRMYGMVPYQLSGIQAGIQFGHAVVEYMRKYRESEEVEISRWADVDKTFIILNGGTFNSRTAYWGDQYAEQPAWAAAAGIHSLPVGTMDRYALELETMNIPVARFNEPDANDALLAFCFLVDDRVFEQLRVPEVKSMLRELNRTGVDLNDFHLYLNMFGSRENFYLALFLVDKGLAQN